MLRETDPCAAEISHSPAATACWERSDFKILVLQMRSGAMRTNHLLRLKSIFPEDFLTSCRRFNCSPSRFTAHMKQLLSKFAYLFSAASVPGRGMLGLRRFAPWKGSIQPGYSGSKALISSSCLSSSSESLRSTAAMLSVS